MNIKNKLLIIPVLILLLATVLFLAIKQIEKNSMERLSLIADGNGASEKIQLFYDNDSCYAFLPSYSDLRQLTIEYPESCKVYLNHQYLPSGQIIDQPEVSSEYQIEMKNQFGWTIDHKTLIFMKSEKISSMFLNIEDGNIEDINNSEDKSVKKAGTCHLINADGTVKYNGMFSVLKGRGNSTWKADKKPYELRFDHAVNLLGEEKNKQYCLLANALDKTNLRNKIVYDTAQKTALPYSVNSEYIDLYIDGSYYGLYLLTDDITVGENGIQINDLKSDTQEINNKNLKEYSRIENKLSSTNPVTKKNVTIYDEVYYDIPENPTDITGGYLIELENNYRLKNVKSGFSSSNHNYGYHICAPEYASQKQVDYISSFVRMTETDIYDDELGKYLDLESWVRFYLLNEVFANSDSGSMYFYKNADSIDSKLYAGPVWDFDLSMGQYFGDTIPQPDVLYKNNFYLFKKIYDNTECVQMIKDTYNNLFREELVSLCSEGIHHYCSMIEKSFDMDHTRWKNASNYDWIRKIDNISQAETEIQSFLSMRIIFLDSIWTEDKTPPLTVFFTSTVNNDSNTRKNFYYPVKSGDTLSTIPVIEFEGKELVGWYNTKTGEKLDPDAPIVENVQFIAVWKDEDK